MTDDRYAMIGSHNRDIVEWNTCDDIDTIDARIDYDEKHGEGAWLAREITKGKPIKTT